MTTHRTARVRLSALASAALAAAVALGGCTGGSSAPADPPSSGGKQLISKERCAQNRAAGEITYITGFGWQASAGILEEVAADGLGYYRDLCLDVTIKPGTGDTAQNAALVASGTAQVTAVGNESEVLTARAGGSDVVGIATLGHVPIATLMTMPDVTDLEQLDGTTLGHNGGLPAPVQAMLVKAGADVPSIKQVNVKFQKELLPEGEVQSLTGYRSNEPARFAADGTKIKQWDPEDFRVSGSFAAMAANEDFLEQHPTAAQDFLRASLHAFEHCRADQQAAEECVDLAAKRDQTGAYEVEHNLEVWKIESGLVRSSTPEDQPVGYFDSAATEAEAADTVASGQLESIPDLEAAFDGATMAAVHDGTTLVWPAP